MTDIPGVGEINFFELLELLNVDNVHPVGLNEIGFSCIFTENHPFGDQHPSCHMNRNHGAWRCKSCHRQGGIIDFVSVVKQCKGLEAIRWLRTHFGDVYVAPQGTIVEDVSRRLNRGSEEELRRMPDEEQTIGPNGIFRVDWNDDDEQAVQYMVHKRGLDRDVLYDAGVGWDSWTSRVVIPYRDEDGILVGFNGRSISDGQKQRYMVLGDDAVKNPRYGVGYGFDMMQVECHLYGLYEALQALSYVPDTQRELIVIEGEINRLTVVNAMPNVVSSGNAWLSAQQIRLLRRNASSVLFFFDSDEAGEKALWGGYDEEKQKPINGVIQKLSPYMGVRVAPEHEGDANSIGIEASVDLVSRSKSWLRAMID